MQTLDLGPQTDEVARIVAGVRDAQLTDPTPCAGTPLDGGPQASADKLDPDWRSTLPERLDALAAAWRDPEAWRGMASVGGAELPAPAMGGIALNEVLVHGWDLAVAT